MAWASRFVYRNYVDDSTVTATDEVSTLPDDNLQSFQPSEVWRASTLSSLNVQIIGGANGAREWDVVWIGYTNLTPKMNLLIRSNALDTTWTAENITVVENSGLAIAPRTSTTWRLTASGGGSISHGINQTWTPTLTMKANQTFTKAFYINVSELGTNPDEMEFAMETNTGAAVSVLLDLGAGTLASVTHGTGWSSGVASVSSVVVGSVTSFRVVLTAAQANVITTLKFRARMAMSGSTSFTQAGEQVYASSGFMTLGSSSVEEDETTTEHAAGLRLEAIGATVETMSDYYPAVARDQTDAKDDAGWAHGVAHVNSTVHTAITWKLYISDETNLDSNFEAGRMMIGKSFKPVGTMSSLSRTWDSGRAIWEIQYEHSTVAEAERDFLDMYRYSAKRSETEVESAGGQRYSPDNKPVLFIADDAATTSEPERVIYGTLIGSQPIVNMSQTRYRTTIRISELPK